MAQDPGLVAEVIRKTLTGMILAPSYADEQKELQRSMKDALDGALTKAFPTATDIRTIISIDGSGKPNLRLLGTTFWPDIEVREDDTRLAAVEVKLIRPQHRASKAIAEAIGQAIIYSIRYPHVFAFVVHHGRKDARYHDEDARLENRLLPLNVELIFRGPGASGAQSRQGGLWVMS